MQSKESSDANSELFKEDDDEAMYKNPYEIRLCDLISVSLEKCRAKGAGWIPERYKTHVGQCHLCHCLPQTIHQTS